MHGPCDSPGGERVSSPGFGRGSRGAGIQHGAFQRVGTTGAPKGMNSLSQGWSPASDQSLPRLPVPIPELCVHLSSTRILGAGMGLEAAVFPA